MMRLKKSRERKREREAFEREKGERKALIERGR